MLVRCDRSAIVLHIGLVDNGQTGIFGVRSGVFGSDKFISVGAVFEDPVAFSMASLAADIRVSSYVSISLSEICLLALVFSSSTCCICKPSVAGSSFR